jgi:GrpB-like predicted nucleotidyltransferase (UPF0157 family)
MPEIVIVPYRPGWPAEFHALAAPLRAELGDLALRIDHIGSTAVPGLAAKDRIDLQVTVRALEPPVEQAIRRAGFERVGRINRDHLPPGFPEDRPQDWVKWFFNPLPGARPANLHVRLEGRPNQRYPLLFRDYLRAHPAAAEAYAQIKIALAERHPDDMDAYYAVKDPVCDLIIGAAELWAASQGWLPGPSDA